MNQGRVTLSEAAQLLGVHRNTIRNWVLAGKLTSGEKHQRSDGVEQWTVSEDEILGLRRDRPASKSADSEPMAETAWMIHDLAIRLADAEARAARAETKLEEAASRESTTTRDTETKDQPKDG
jgi:hypothetical protein